MEIITDKKTESIHVDDIDNRYIIVGNINNRPAILTMLEYNNASSSIFMCLDNGFTVGNNYSNYSGVTVKEIVEKFISKGNKAEAFHHSDWKDALKWLIDNVE